MRLQRAITNNKERSSIADIFKRLKCRLLHLSSSSSSIMKFASSVFASLLVGGARAFSPRPLARSFHASRLTLHANVLKLSDPQKELLGKVDVFIFDCDGVIWRVSPFIVFRKRWFEVCMLPSSCNGLLEEMRGDDVTNLRAGDSP